MATDRPIDLDRLSLEDVQAVTDGLARLLGPPTPWLKALRNAGISAVDRLPLLKRALAQPALR